MEKIVPLIIPPWVEPPKIYIERDKLRAKISHERLLQMLSTESTGYYTDWSGINQKVGATAVQLGQTFKKVSAFLGSSIYYTIYAAELSGILVPLHMALADSLIPQGRRILIFTDNQSALRSIHKPRKTSGQTIIRDILEVIQRLRTRDTDTEVYWVPAHIGIAGNEKADIAAKESTGWRTHTKRNNRQIEIDTDRTALQIWVHPLKAAIRAIHRQQVHESWKISWSNEVKGQDLRLIVSQPDRKGLKIHTNLKRPQSSLLVQMRTAAISTGGFVKHKDKCF